MITTQQGSAHAYRLAHDYVYWTDMLRGWLWVLCSARSPFRRRSGLPDGSTPSLRISINHGDSPRPALFNTRSCRVCLCIALFFVVFHSTSTAIRHTGNPFNNGRITSRVKSFRGKVSPSSPIPSNGAGSAPISSTTSFSSGFLYHHLCLPSFVICHTVLRSPPGFSTSTQYICDLIYSPYDTVTLCAYGFPPTSLVFDNDLATSFCRCSFSVSTLLTIRPSRLSIIVTALCTTSRF